MATLLNKSKNTILANNLAETRGPWSRLKGLLGTSELPLGNGLWIPKCNSIHTCFMNYAIDVVFVDRDLRVQYVKKEMEPWKLILPVWRAASVFELPAGMAAKCATEVGDQLHVGA